MYNVYIYIYIYVYTRIYICVCMCAYVCLADVARVHVHDAPLGAPRLAPWEGIEGVTVQYDTI